MKAGQTGNPDFAAASSLEGRVWKLFGQGDAKQAVAECENLNRQYPEYGSGWHTASHLMMKLGNAAAALAAIERALSVDPEKIEWYLQRAMCLARLGRIDELKPAVQALSERKMKSAYQMSSLGMLLTQLGSREAAADLYKQAAELEPDDSRNYYNLACLQRSLGELAAAEENYDVAIRLNSADYESYKIRSELRPQTKERNHVKELEQVLTGNLQDDRGWVQVSYALAKELEDLGEAERSFKHLKAGSDRRRKLMKYEVDRDLETIDAIKRTFDRGVLENAEPGCENPEPIFILGMPRTGTTLVERILASHSDVFAAGELNNFAAQLMTMMRAQNVDKKISRDQMVESSAQLDFQRLGESYIASTRPFTGSSKRFIDKMPLNYLYVGLIHLAMPNATIINLQRDPMDTCYAIYKQLFVDAYPFSYDLEELARYFVAYHRLMQHWNEVLPGVIHTIQYEELVDDIEDKTRQMLGACNLDWQAQCLKFYENKEASTTASTAQIRRPVYKSSVGKWKDYEEYLQPAVEILQRAGVLKGHQA